MTLRYLIRLNCLQRWTSDITPFVKAKMFASSTRNDNVVFAQGKLFTLLSESIVDQVPILVPGSKM